MAGIGSFLSGFAGNVNDQLAARTKTEEDIRKARLLEQLRSETEKEMTLWKESRPEAQEDLRYKRTMREANEEKLRQDREMYPLDRAIKQRQFDYMAEDQAMQRERLALDRQSVAERRADRAEARAARDSAQKQARQDVLYQDYNNVYTRMKDAGANEYELSRLEAQWRKSIDEGKSPDWQQKFLRNVMNDYSKKVDFQQRHGLLPSQQSRNSGD